MLYLNVNELLLSVVLIAVLILMIYLIKLAKESIASIKKTNEILDDFDCLSKKIMPKSEIVSNILPFVLNFLKESTQSKKKGTSCKTCEK